MVRPTSQARISAVSLPRSRQGPGAHGHAEERARAEYPPDTDVPLVAKCHKQEVLELPLRIEASDAAGDTAACHTANAANDTDHQREQPALEDHVRQKSADKPAEAGADSRRRPARGAAQVEDEGEDHDSKHGAEGTATAGGKTSQSLKAAPAAREPFAGIAVVSADGSAAAAAAAAAACAARVVTSVASHESPYPREHPSHTEARSSTCAPPFCVDRLIYLHDNNGVPAFSTASARGCLVWTRTPLSESVVAALNTSGASAAAAAAAAAAGPGHSEHAGKHRNSPLDWNGTSNHKSFEGHGNVDSNLNDDPLHESEDNLLSNVIHPTANDLARSWGIWRAHATYQHLLQEAAQTLWRGGENLSGFYTSSGEPLHSIGISLLLSAHSELHLIARTGRREALRQPRRLALRHHTPSSSAIAFEYRESALKCRVHEGAIIATYARARRQAKSAAIGRGAATDSVRAGATSSCPPVASGVRGIMKSLARQGFSGGAGQSRRRQETSCEESAGSQSEGAAAREGSHGYLSRQALCADSQRKVRAAAVDGASWDADCVSGRLPAGAEGSGDGGPPDRARARPLRHGLLPWRRSEDTGGAAHPPLRAFCAAERLHGERGGESGGHQSGGIVGEGLERRSAEEREHPADGEPEMGPGSMRGARVRGVQLLGRSSVALERKAEVAREEGGRREDRAYPRGGVPEGVRVFSRVGPALWPCDGAGCSFLFGGALIPLFFPLQSINLWPSYPHSSSCPPAVLPPIPPSPSFAELSWSPSPAPKDSPLSPTPWAWLTLNKTRPQSKILEVLTKSTCITSQGTTGYQASGNARWGPLIAPIPAAPQLQRAQPWPWPAARLNFPSRARSRSRRGARRGRRLLWRQPWPHCPPSPPAMAAAATFRYVWLQEMR